MSSCELGHGHGWRVVVVVRSFVKGWFRAKVSIASGVVVCKGLNLVAVRVRVWGQGLGSMV